MRRHRAKNARVPVQLRQMEQKKGYEYDTLIDLDITSPLRQTGDIEGAYEVKASGRTWT